MSLAHLGTAGRDSASVDDVFLDQLGITAITGPVRQIRRGAIDLVDGRTLPFAYAMLIPPFLGVDAIRACDRITNASGFVQVDEFGRTFSYPEVFAAGSAVATEPQWRNYATWDGGQTDSLGERMGRQAAHNIAALIQGGSMTDQLFARPAAAGGDRRAAGL